MPITICLIVIFNTVFSIIYLILFNITSSSISEVRLFNFNYQNIVLFPGREPNSEHFSAL